VAHGRDSRGSLAFFDMSEVFVARSERSFAMNSEGRGKRVDRRQFVFGSQFSCGASQPEISVYDFQRQLCDIIQNLPSDPQDPSHARGVVYFAPIHDGHKQLAFAFDAQPNQILDFVGPRTIFQRKS